MTVREALEKMFDYENKIHGLSAVQDNKVSFCLWLSKQKAQAYKSTGQWK